MKTSYYVAVSLDGFIAKADGDVSWLEQLDIAPEDSDYEAFFTTVDGLVMGRATYEKIVGYGEWPYGDKSVWVCSHQPIQAMQGMNLQAETEPQAVHKAAQALGLVHLWLVGGGQLATSFAQLKLLDELNVAQMPILLGQGIPLFAEGFSSLLKLKSISQPSERFIQAVYSMK